MQTASELVLLGEGDSTRRARTFAAARLETESAELTLNAQLVVTELVTNALLHGEVPVTVRVEGLGGRARIEVGDRGRALPVQVQGRPDAMTGRGLELVRALSSRWGVEPDPHGKTVWAELGESSLATGTADLFADVEALLDTWPAPTSGEARHTVRLGAVPTDLLLAAKSHVDNVVRELTLMRAEESTSGEQLPPAMARLVTAATEDFAEARREIKRQALAAARRGEQVVDLVLNLPMSAASAGERYLTALEEADRHARAARMLTLAPPRSHQAFRRWYVEALVDQLRAAARGETAPQAEPFPQVMAREVDRLSSLEESWRRLQLLQRITSDLTGAASVEEIARIVVGQSGRYPGVESARVFILTDSNLLRSIARFGTDSAEDDRYDEFPIEAELPGAHVARTGEPLFLRSLAQIEAHFPQLTGYYPDERSLHVVPLTLSGHVLGVLTLAFVGGYVADDAQLSFVRAIADVLAQAIERAKANERAETERHRDRRLLAAQLNVLADIVAGQPLTDALSSLLRAVEAVSADGMLASVLLLDDDGIHLRHCAAPSLPDDYSEAIDGIAIGPAVGSCGTAAYRREQVIVEDIDRDPLWRDFRDLALGAGLRACWSTPIVGSRGQLLGTFALYYPDPHRPDAGDFALVSVLVRAVTMAIERSRADEAREKELAAERAAALTLQHSLLPAVPDTVGPLRLAARYRTGDPGVEVGGDWFDAVAVPRGVVLVVGDVQGHDLRAAALMGQLRTVARASASEGHSPGRVLESLHRYMAQIDTELLTTAVVVHVDTQTREATVASAGHLAPLRIAPDPDVGWRALDVDVDVGPPLGLGESWPEATTGLPAGSVLLLYTDGLVETRTWPLDHGLMLLRKSLEALPAHADLSTFLDAAFELVPTGSRGDDVAALAALTPA